jgi:AraC-like DNA-binding protein
MPSTGNLRLRIPLPSVLLCVTLPPMVVEQLRAIVGDRAELRTAGCLKDAAAHLERLLNGCLLVSVPGEEQQPLASELLRLRASYPHVPAVAFFLPGRSSYRRALQLGSAGVTELIAVDPVLPAQELLTSLSRCHADGVAIRLWRHCALDIPDALLPLLKAAVRLAHEPLTAVRLAAAAGMHERTLRKYCENARLPSPQWVIGWARLLLAGYYLDEPGRTISSVAEMLRFPSTCALRNQLRRYTNVAPSHLRADGASRALARLLEQSVREHDEGPRVDTARQSNLRLVR